MIAVLEGHSGAGNKIAYSTDGTLLASTGEDGTVRLSPIPQESQLGHHGAKWCGRAGR
ncbi:WD40 repeat domain-containing protein [Actinomadura chokoriensis]|uniref:WD40 repeat domain-containing protein n=1 Tax=Actinomadura chokoriensis TaxID=454156 RepID=UPI0031F98DED